MRLKIKSELNALLGFFSADIIPESAFGAGFIKCHHSLL
jgi:hypothetical protein